MVGSRTTSVNKNGFLSVVKRGDIVDLWNELGVDGRPLKEVFLRCFALVVNKKGVVEDFDNWDGTKWVWPIPTRRLLFDWDKD